MKPTAGRVYVQVIGYELSVIRKGPRSNLVKKGSERRAILLSSNVYGSDYVRIYQQLLSRSSTQVAA
jgi:hypothetical protein